tara:strand:- start:2368 stop:2490 length:123 start_codon:yes stop_codon:yes gene_type:complete
MVNIWRFPWGGGEEAGKMERGNIIIVILSPVSISFSSSLL